MCVQPNALGLKAIQYIVLYYLTPPRFHRYSSLICARPIQPGRIDLSRHHSGAGGIGLVNRLVITTTDDWPLITGHWPLRLQGVYVA